MQVKCTSCGALQNISQNKNCDFCGNIIELESASNNYKNSVQSESGNLMSMAETSLEATNYEEALSYFNRVLEKDISNSDAWLGKGISIVYTSKIGDLKINEAIAYFKNAVKHAQNQEAMSKRVAKEIDTVVNTFYPTIENHFIQFRDLENSYKELVSRFSTLEKAQFYATQIDSDNIKLYETGYNLCKRVVEVPKKQASSDMTKAIIGGVAAAFESNGFKGIKGNSNAASDERSARARKKEIMESAQLIFKIEEKYVENIKRLNPSTTIVSSLETYLNSAEGKTIENTKIIKQAFNESPSKGVKVWWEKLTTKQKLTIALVLILMILGAMFGEK
jgi:tetratricopeptide (TPR) repeat protein